LLVGASFFYAVVGQLGLSDLGNISNILDGTRTLPAWLTLNQFQVLLSLGGVLITVAFCFKIGLAPFHFWVRDVYEGGAYPVVAMVAALPKLVMIIVWMRLFTPMIVMHLPHWSILVTILGLLSMFGGNLLALAQERVRSLLAYSSIGHMGFVLLALTLVNYTGNHAALMYTLGYLLTVGVVLLVMARLSRAQTPLLLIDDLKGLSRVQPLLASLLAVSFLSLLGMPPFAGFMFKMNLLYVLMQADQAWLALSVVAATIIGAYYYINMIGLMFFYDVEPSSDQLLMRSSWLLHAGMVTFIFLLIVVGLYPEYVFNRVHQALLG
jgi:NADH-quinone oxidoreductase subunit N